MRPLLKWVGGKRQLLPQLRRFYPAEFNRYIEPFFGSGAVFFDLHARGLLRGKEAVLIDANVDLIGCYHSVRDAPEEVVRELERLADEHARDARATYYSVRDERFNPLRDRLRDAGGDIAYTPALAAMFLYLNRTGFNGLFRVNKRGAFNVPAGRYERPRIVDREKLMRVGAALSAPGVRLICGSFETALQVAEAGDFLYFDPPYAPVSPTANFTSYTPQRFDRGTQERLQQVVIEMAGRGCHVLVSNSTAQEVVALYDANLEARRSGLLAYRVAARRAVNSQPSGRGPILELLITNVARGAEAC